ncbi:MAG: polysaccharide biosynthesis/export family protein [Verrucomicrobiales bacterium]|nr:polysaccharide biosynthesis/export family protein [Verrucomicrobiales bacterium]
MKAFHWLNRVVLVGALLSCGPIWGQTGELALKSGDKFTLKVGGIHAEDAVQLAGTYTVGDDGTVPLLHLGNYSVAGVTPSALQRKISQAYITAQIYAHPSVLVSVNDDATKQFVTVISGVMAPGSVPYARGLTVLEAIGNRGGPSKFADMRRVTLIRTDEKGKLVTTVHNLKDYAKHPEEDAVLLPGDKVIVRE